jgi:hypothetical protein
MIKNTMFKNTMKFDEMKSFNFVIFRILANVFDTLIIWGRGVGIIKPGSGVEYRCCIGVDKISRYESLRNFVPFDR